MEPTIYEVAAYAIMTFLMFWGGFKMLVAIVKADEERKSGYEKDIY